LIEYVCRPLLAFQLLPCLRIVGELVEPSPTAAVEFRAEGAQGSANATALPIAFKQPHQGELEGMQDQGGDQHQGEHSGHTLGVELVDRAQHLSGTWGLGRGAAGGQSEHEQHQRRIGQ